MHNLDDLCGKVLDEIRSAENRLSCLVLSANGIRPQDVGLEPRVSDKEARQPSGPTPRSALSSGAEPDLQHRDCSSASPSVFDRTVFNNGFDITLSFKPAVGLIGLRKVRRLRGVSQKQLADAIGVSIQFISLLETGKRNCSSEVLQKLAYVLRCTTDELIKAPSYSGGENCGTVTNG